MTIKAETKIFGIISLGRKDPKPTYKYRTTIDMGRGLAVKEEVPVVHRVVIASDDDVMVTAKTALPYDTSYDAGIASRFLHKDQITGLKIPHKLLPFVQTVLIWEATKKKSI